MTPTTKFRTLRESCAIIGWSARELAERLERNPRTVQRWWSENEAYEPPKYVVEWADMVASFILRNPPPRA